MTVPVIHLLLRRLSLVVGKICRNSDHSLDHFLAQFHFGNFFHLEGVSI